MKITTSIGIILALAGGITVTAFSVATAQVPVLPGELPPSFQPTNSGFDHVRREVMIPMRDGVKLHTVILIPNGARRTPILLTRTPYNATELTSYGHSAHLAPSLTGYDNATEVIIAGGYIRVVQDVRLASTAPRATT